MLSQLVDQFEKRHQRPPDEIIVHPVALVALALKQSVAPKWRGIPVTCLEVKPRAKSSGRKLGITVLNGALTGFDL